MNSTSTTESEKSNTILNDVSKKQPEDKKEVDQLKEKLAELDKEIAEYKAEGFNEDELQVHIEKMHEYNEIKDVGQMVLGRIASIEGVRSKDLYPKYGLDLKD